MLKLNLSSHHVIIAYHAIFNKYCAYLESMRPIGREYQYNACQYEGRISKILVYLVRLWGFTENVVRLPVLNRPIILYCVTAIMVVFFRIISCLPVICQHQKHKRHMQLGIGIIPSKPLPSTGGRGHQDYSEACYD